MAFREIVESMKLPEGASDRYRKLEAYERQLAGDLYRDLRYPFSQETDQVGNPIKLSDRRPELQFNLARIIFNETQGALWGDEQQPYIRCSEQRVTSDADAHENEENALQDMIERLNLDAVMMESYRIGQPGSVAIIVRRARSGAPDFDIVSPKEVMPIFDPLEPAKLAAIEHVYPVSYDELKRTLGAEKCDQLGYSMLDKTYWFRILIDGEAEYRYKALPAKEYRDLGGRRADNTVIAWELTGDTPHAWRCVPCVWIRNLSNLVGVRGKPDGECTWAPIDDGIVSLDYMISQNQRGLRYSADPMLFITRGKGRGGSGIAPIGDADGQAVRAEEGAIVKGPTQVLTESEGGTAQLLEMKGTGLQQIIEYIRYLREYLLEVISGSKASASDVKGAAHSGAALDKMDRPLRFLIRRQRKAYGDLGFIPLVRLLLFGIANGAIDFALKTPVDPNIPMQLEWPPEDDMGGDELNAFAQAIDLLAGGSQKMPMQLLDPKFLSRYVAHKLGIRDRSAIVADPKPLPPPPDGAGTATPDGSQ